MYFGLSGNRQRLDMTIYNEEAISKLDTLCLEKEAACSSLWEILLNDFRCENGKIYSPHGLQYVERRVPKRALFDLLSHYVLNNPFRMTGARFRHYADYDRAARRLVRQLGCLYDLRMMRQVLTLALIHDHVPLHAMREPMVVIGDYWGVMASLILTSLPRSKVVVVNLTKVLLSDLSTIRRAFPYLNVCLVKEAGDYQTALSDPSLRVIAIRADDADLLGESPIGLAINLLSMQEMHPDAITIYFDAFRRAPNSQTVFYCCNRNEVGLGYRGFFDYPWHPDDTCLVDELCPWVKYSYCLYPPFYRLHGPAFHHRLAILRKPVSNRQPLPRQPGRRIKSPDDRLQ